MDIVRKETVGDANMYIVKNSGVYLFVLTKNDINDFLTVKTKYSLNLEEINNEFRVNFLNEKMFEKAVLKIPNNQFKDLILFLLDDEIYSTNYKLNYLQIIFQEAFARVYPYMINENKDLIIRYINFQIVFTLDTSNVLIITCGELHPMDDSVTKVRAFAFTEPYIDELFKSEGLSFDFILNHVDYRNLSKKIGAYYYQKKFNNLPEMNLLKDITAYQRRKKINMLLNA